MISYGLHKREMVSLRIKKNYYVKSPKHKIDVQVY